MRKDFPIVCVGGSAGSLDAYKNLLKLLPSDMGIAIIIVNHVSRSPAVLHELLSRYTAMPVELITGNLCIRPNHVFIIPSNRDLHVVEGVFVLRPKSKTSGWPDVITVFLRSLAHHWSGKLVAVIVSGLDSDGSDALKEIKAVGGITIAQSPETAEWSDMPESAIKTGYVDYILSVDAIAKRIVQIASRHALND